MKTDVHVGWKEFLKVVMTIVLVVSLVPISTTQNEQVAFASDASAQKNQVDVNQEEEETWQFWSDIYPEEYTGKNTQNELDVDALVNANSDAVAYTKGGEDFFSKLVDQIAGNAKKNGSLVFDTSTEGVTVEKADEFFKSNGAGTVKSSNSNAIALKSENNRVPETKGGSAGSEVSLNYSISTRENYAWSLSFKVKGKNSGASEVSVDVTATFDKNKTVKIKSTGFSDLSYTVNASNDALIDFGAVKKIKEVVDVQVADQNAVKAVLDNLKAKRDKNTKIPEDGLSLIYPDYKMDDVEVENDSEALATISFINDETGCFFQVTGKKSAKNVDCSLNLSTAQEMNLFDDSYSFKMTVEKGLLHKETEQSKLMTLDYRYEEDQLTEAKKPENLDKLIEGYEDLNGNIWEGSDLIDADSISITRYPEAALDFEQKQDAYLTFKLKSECSEDFEVSGSESYENTMVEFKVNPIQNSEVSNLTIKGEAGDGSSVSPIGDEWAAGNVEVSWNNHTLKVGGLPETRDGFDDVIVPEDQNNGVKVMDKIYAKDSQTNVITKVEGTTFNIDNIAPVVTQMSVETKEAANETTGILDKLKTFFFGVDKKSTVDMLVSDGADGILVSGFEKNSAVHVDYSDAGQNNRIDANLRENTSSSSSHTKDNFGFEVSGKHDIVTQTFKVTLQDRAKNEAKEVQPLSQIPSEVLRLVMYGAKPTVNVEFDNNDAKNGKFYEKDRTATVTITDDHFDYIQTYASNQPLVTYTVNGNVSYAYPRDFENRGGVWVWANKFSMDADYTLSAQVTNLANESARVGEQSWTIDKTAPSANVVWDNDNAENGNYYSASRTATVTITEHNFDAGVWKVVPTGDAGRASEYSAPTVDGWSHYGDSHICHVTFPAQGKFSMTIDGEDSAKNQMATYDVSEFVVDTIQPEISIYVNGEQNASSHAYAGKADVSISITDANVDSLSEVNLESISWNGNAGAYVQDRSETDTSISVTMPDLEYVAENDGVYRVTVNAKDLAGNTQTQTLDWSVNRFGSTYVVSNPTRGIISKKYVKNSDMTDVLITEINPSGIDESSASAKVVRGTSTQEVQRGDDFTFGAAEDANGWPAYSYTIAKGEYATDAMYQTIVSSVDSAGRISDNTMAEKSYDRNNSADVTFAVDNTAPIVTFSGFDEAIVAGSSHKVTAHVEDNMKLDHAVIEVNGKETKTLSEDDLKSKGHEIELHESSDTQKVTVTAYDAAGNVVTQDSSSIFISNDALARLMHNTGLFAGLIVTGGFVVGLGLWWFFIFKRRKKDEEDEVEEVVAEGMNGANVGSAN